MGQAVEGLVYKVLVDPTSGVAGLKVWDRATAETEAKTRKAASSIEQGIEKAASRTSTLGRSMSGLDSILSKISASSAGTSAGMMGIATKFGLVGASITGAIYGLDRFMDAADRITDLTKGFDALTGKAGILGDELLGRMADGAEGFVTNADLMRAANLALVEDLPVTTDKMAQLVEQGVKLAKVVGQDETQAIQALIEAAGRQSDRMLRTMGVSIDFDRVQKDLAKSLGVTVEMLTEGEKKAAFFDAELAALSRATGGLSDDTLSLSDGWKAAWNHVKNFSSALLHAVNVGVPEILFGPDRFASSTAGMGSELTPGLTLEEMRGARVSPETLRIMDQRLREMFKIPEAPETLRSIELMQKAIDGLGRELKATSDAGAATVLRKQIEDLQVTLDQSRQKAGFFVDPSRAILQQIATMERQAAGIRAELGRTADAGKLAVLARQGHDLEDAITKAKIQAGLFRTELEAVAGPQIAPGSLLWILGDLGAESFSGIQGGLRDLEGNLDIVRAALDRGEISWEEYNLALDAAAQKFEALSKRAGSVSIPAPPELATRVPGSIESGPRLPLPIQGEDDANRQVQGLARENIVNAASFDRLNQMIAETKAGTVDYGVSLNQLILLQDENARAILAAAAAGEPLDAALVKDAQDVFMLADALRTVQGEALTFEGQMWALVVGSEAWGGALAAIQGHLGRTGAAFANMGGTWGKVGRFIQKVQAGMLLVEGIKGIRTGAIKVKEGIYPPNPGLIASGVGMIAEGLAAIAQAKQLGASGGGGSSGGGGGGGAAGGSAESSSERIGAGFSKGREEGGSGQSEYYVPERQRESKTTTIVKHETVVNNHWNVETLDGASFEEKLLKDPRWRRATFEAVAIEQG